ncbi:hypothetical protein CONCODRAFT_2058 [Conidiobolus coronatus NRRL 28638]|uniref:Tricalbin n=1 Tax=Conidiobolus coronatus (strain ATCC 28846 / CBS 209.66 / NRRL 28638) TaxID=796925 RepID=A0A137PIC3_CONC2|nr:hypothetical protein CONCODRAFT_2058 [Conidiobolus coronatus NRRL 28638]|eukprot:KXN74747.1 hypothetical protein CONCODRAFT_2058 [Conidiobolus coronatus NRRL 28638]
MSNNVPTEHITQEQLLAEIANKGANQSASRAPPASAPTAAPALNVPSNEPLVTNAPTDLNSNAPSEYNTPLSPAQSLDTKSNLSRADSQKSKAGSNISANVVSLEKTGVAPVSSGQTFQGKAEELLEKDDKQSKDNPNIFIGWKEVNENRKKSRIQALDVVQGDIKLEYYQSVSVIFVTVLFTWAGVVLGGGITWCIIVIACVGTYYKNVVERFRRNIRDDAIRELSIEKMEQNSESVEWLNNFLNRFWVIYEPGLSATIVAIVDSVLEVSTPPFLDSLKLTTFTLGNKAPRILSVRTHPRTEKDTVLMDWDIEFVPNDNLDMTQREIQNQVNPKIVLQVRVGKGIVGAGIPILVEDVALKATARVKIKFYDVFPHIEVVSLMMLTVPTIDYVLKPIGGDTFGFDVAHIPGLQSFIRDQIHAILKPMMYNPHEFELKIGDMLTGPGYNPVIGLLKVTVKSARNLKGGDVIGSPDPYVAISTDTRGLLQETKHKSDTRNPNFNEDVTIILYNLSEDLKFEVKDRNKFGGDGVMGTATFALSQLEQNSTQADVSLGLFKKNIQIGSLQVDTQFYPVLKDSVILKSLHDPSTLQSEVGILRLTLHQLQELDLSKSITGKFTPYCHISVNGQHMLTTRKKKRNNSPSFEEYIELVVTDIANSHVSIVVKDDRGLATDPELGSWSYQALKLLDPSKSNGWYPLSNCKTGKIRVTAKWHPLDIPAEQSLSGGSSSSCIGVVRLAMFQASQLKNPEKATSSPDPFVQVTMGGKDVGRTQVIKNDASPIWNRVIFFPVYRPTALVTLEVFDENTMRADDPLGTVEFQLSSIIETEEDTHLARTPLDNWDLLTYKGKQCGLIHYSASFHPLSLPPPSSKDEVAQPDAPTTDASEKPKEVVKELYQWDYSQYSKFLAKVKIHSAKGLPDGNYRAMVCLNSSKVNNYLVSEAQNKSSSTPIFNSSTSVFIPGLTTTQLNVFIQEGKEDRAIDVATWNCMANELVELVGEKKWVSCRPNGELCVSLDLLPVDYDESVEQFSQTQGRLAINIIEGRNLVAADSGGTSDPYIEIKLNGHKVYKSQVIKKTLNPVYNEIADIPILNSMGSYLRFKVYDWNRLESKDPLGNFSFNVADLTPNEPFEQYFTLKDIAHGEIKLRMTFKPGQLSLEDMRSGSLYVGSGASIRNTATTMIGSSTFTPQSANSPMPLSSVNSEDARASTDVRASTDTRSIVSTDNNRPDRPNVPGGESTGIPGALILTLIEAKDLKAVDSNGFSDPYVRIKVREKTLHESQIIKKSLTPVWNETVRIVIPNGDPYFITLSVRDYNKIKSDVSLGDVTFNLWDIISDIQPNSHYETNFWTNPLRGGEPGRVRLNLEFNTY